MARIDDLPLATRVFLKGYPFRTSQWRPGASLAAPLKDCRLGLVTTAAFTLPDQPVFDESKRGGDVSFRLLPTTSEPQAYTMSHRSKSFDHEGVEKDSELAFPLSRMMEFVSEGVVGGLVDQHVSLNGSITAPGRLVRETIPRLVGHFRQQRADVVLLVPV